MSLEERVEVSLSESELASIDAAATRAGISRSEFVRQAADRRASEIISWITEVDERGEKVAEIRQT